MRARVAGASAMRVWRERKDPAPGPLSPGVEKPGESASRASACHTRRWQWAAGSRRVASILCLSLLVLAPVGCAIGPGNVPSQIRLTVTRDFGSRSVGEYTIAKVPGAETMIGLLRRSARVLTGPDGRSVQSIAGVSARPPERWFYYVNGQRVSQSSAAITVHPGDRVWWDLHDPGPARDAPVVIGSFPEPFLNGLGGQRLPVRVECVNVQSDPCRTVTTKLRSLGVPAAIAGIGVTEGLDTLRVLVGPWAALQGDPGVQIIRAGPQSSGVYASFATSGVGLTLFDEAMRPVRTLDGDVGLVAAARFSDERPEWVITGTDGRGVELAAKALTQKQLERHFALALTSTARISIPLRSAMDPAG